MMHSPPEYLPSAIAARAPGPRSPLAFVVRSGKLLMHEGEAVPRVPLLEELDAVDDADPRHHLGSLQERHCIAWEAAADFEPPPGMEWRDLYQLLLRLDAPTLSAAGAAVQIVEWEKNHRHCGRCGTVTESLEHSGERSRVCRSCKLHFYPRVSPCVIVLVRRGEELLLAHGIRHPAGMYSPLAGFVEPGESVEQTARREVLEEVGVQIGGLRYFSSQPWPFPHQLMVGFFADYHSGELQPDRKEILEARWWHYRELPEVPGEYSISGRLIQEAVRELGEVPQAG